MIEMLLLFVLMLLTVLARWLVYGAFEPLQFALIFLLPAAALAVYIISRKLAEKERSYQPKNIYGWSFYNIQKSLLIRKPLFRGDELRGYVRRYFPHKWQYAFGDVIGFNWYLCLKIQIDQDLYDVRWHRKKWLTNQDNWNIFKNGERIGEARTLINMKNAASLKEAIQYTINDDTYLSSAATIASAISLTREGEKCGILKRHHLLSSVKVIDPREDSSPEAIVALILHSYFFKNK
jgi:hypothetical protein